MSQLIVNQVTNQQLKIIHNYFAPRDLEFLARAGRDEVARKLILPSHLIGPLESTIHIDYNVRIMISSLPSYDDDLLNSAYANISLIADEVWTYDREDPFHKLNRSLWIKVRRVCSVE